MRQWEQEKQPALAAILSVRLRNAGDFSGKLTAKESSVYDRAALKGSAQEEQGRAD